MQAGNLDLKAAQDRFNLSPPPFPLIFSISFSSDHLLLSFSSSRMSSVLSHCLIPPPSSLPVRLMAGFDKAEFFWWVMWISTLKNWLLEGISDVPHPKISMLGTGMVLWCLIKAEDIFEPCFGRKNRMMRIFRLFEHFQIIGIVVTIFFLIIWFLYYYLDYILQDMTYNLNNQENIIHIIKNIIHIIITKITIIWKSFNCPNNPHDSIHSFYSCFLGWNPLSFHSLMTFTPKPEKRCCP